MSNYPDLTATSLSVTATTPSPVVVARRVETTYDGTNMAVVGAALATSSDTPYPMVQGVGIYGTGPFYAVTANVRGVRQFPPSIPPVAPGAASPLGDYESPYNWYTDPTTGARAACASGAYRRGLFTGTSLTVTFDLTQLQAFGSTDYPYFAISVDNGPFLSGKVPTSGSSSVVVTVVSGLVTGIHSYVIMQEYWPGAGRYTNNGFSAIRILAITPSGGVVSRPAAIQPKKMLIYGDSLFEGWNANAIWPAGTPPGSASASCTQTLAHDLSCELGVVANEGQGWLNPVDMPGLETAYPNYISGISRLVSGKFSPLPDYIIVEMGTNDSTFTDAAVRAAVTTTITSLRAAAPGAKIVILLPFTTNTKVTAITNGYNDYQTTPDPLAYLATADTVPQVLLSVPGMSFDGIHFSVAGNIAVEPPVESAINRALGYTSLEWKVKVENPTLVGYPQFFEVDDGGSIAFFATDNVAGDYTMTPFFLATNTLYGPGWTAAQPTLPVNWLLSGRYAIQEQVQQAEVFYPTVPPAPNWDAPTFPAAHIDADTGALVMPVAATPIAGSAADVRAYTLWDTVNDGAIGPPTYVNVPNRRVVGLGDQLSDYRVDQLALTPFPVWKDVLPLGADGSLTVAIPAATQAELTLVQESTKLFKARASMTVQFPREFFFYAGDTDTLDDGSLAYGSDFEEVCFPPYASSVVGITMLTLLETGTLSAADTATAQNAVRYIAMGMANLVQSGGPIPGGTPFGWLQRYGGTGPSIAFYRTGTIAWAAYFMYMALRKLPSSMWTGLYATWKTTIETRAADVMTWCHSQDSGLGLCRFGTGRTDPSTGVFDPGYQYPFHAQEHNSDLFAAELAAFAYTGDSTYHSKATTRMAAMITYMWNDTDGRLYESVDAVGAPNGTNSSLDCYSWGGIALKNGGHEDKAIRAMARTSNYLMASPNDNGVMVRGYCLGVPFDGITDPAPSVWVEGTNGILIAKQRLGLYTGADQSLYEQLFKLQQFDGSFRNFQLTDPTFGITRYRSLQAACWTILARYPAGLWWQDTL